MTRGRGEGVLQISEKYNKHESSITGKLIIFTEPKKKHSKSNNHRKIELLQGIFNYIELLRTIWDYLELSGTILDYTQLINEGELKNEYNLKHKD